MKSALKLLISIVICELAGAIGSIFTMPAIGGWYASLKKPDFNPPNWLFAPVWTILFLLMGISLFLVWQKRFSDKTGSHVRDADMAFGLQLLLNTWWSILFFGLKSPGIAFFEIIFLWLSIIITIIKFSKISKLAAWLLLPYILWVTFAGVLNYFLWMMN